MRTTALILAVLAMAAFDFDHAAAQEADQELTLTGCLAQESGEGEEAEFVLSHLTGTDIMAETVELIPGEDINLEPHVGHTVEVTGTVAADDAEEGMAEESEEESELHLEVTALSHVAASCPADS